MKKQVSSLRLIPLVCLLAGTAAFAQPSGLLFDGGKEGFTLRDTDNGLRLHFTSQPKSGTAKESIPDSTSKFTVPTHNTLRAEWAIPYQNIGLHTSLGLSWDSDKPVSFTGRATTPTTFLGLGWSSAPSRTSRWSLSAELGTSLSNSTYGCFGVVQSCASQRPLGLSGDAAGSGLRLNPYVSFGATYSFDR